MLPRIGADTLTGLGNLLLGAGTLFAAIGAWVGAVRARKLREVTHSTDRHARQALRAANASQAVGTRIATSVGETNGETLAQLLHRVVEFEGYQHDRNHKVLGRLSMVTAGLPMLIESTTSIDREIAALRRDLDAILAALDIEPTPADGDDGG